MLWHPQPQMIHPSSPSTQSIPTYFTMLQRQNKLNMVHLWIGVPMVDLQDVMSGSSPSPPGSALSLALINTKINGLDIVQCAPLVNTNHGYVNLIMNEYAYYGKGHTIHSPGQIEWYKNLVEDKSVKVGGTQCITTLDGYAFPLKCTGGLMYLSVLDKPTDGAGQIPLSPFDQYP